MSTIKVDDIQSRQSTDDAISLASDSSVTLKHSASAKLATTSTGVNITGTCAATAYTGDGSALTGISSGGITVQDEGSALSTAATTLDFVGAGVTASGTGAAKTITVPGGGGSLEFVKKIEPSSAVSSIVETGLEYDRVYRLVFQQLHLSAYGGIRFKPHVDNSSTPHNNSDCCQQYANASTYATVQHSQNQWSMYPHIDRSYAGAIYDLYTGDRAWMFWKYYTFGGPTEPNGLVEGAGWKVVASNTNNDPNQTGSFAKVNGVTIEDIYGANINPGTKLLIYKYKES